MIADFSYLYKHFEKISALHLPGVDAHVKMMPAERKKMLQNIDFDKITPKESAVMAILHPIKGETNLLFIERSIYEGVHSGQIAFPGGKREREDADLYQTACRETCEEVGILSNRLQQIKTLTQVYVPPSNFMITPFLAFHPENMKLTLDEIEVKSAMSISLSDLTNTQNQQLVEMKASYGTLSNMPAYVINDRIVWGATAMIVAEIMDLLQNI